MRLLLAVLAVLGLLLAPAAATAATARCVHEGHGDMAMPMPSGATMAMDAASGEAAAAMPCCDDDAKAPAHDAKACAQDCALMCAAPVALPEAASPIPPPTLHARISASPPKAFQGQAPPGLKRPPRSFI
jgi:hypothetical protein